MKKKIYNFFIGKIRKSIHRKYCFYADFIFCWEQLVELQKMENLELNKWNYK